MPSEGARAISTVNPPVPLDTPEGQRMMGLGTEAVDIVPLNMEGGTIKMSPQAPTVKPNPVSEITDLLRVAVEKQIPVETMEKLVALHERMSDRAAAQEFAEAMAKFQASCPPIPRTAKANIATKTGGRFGYTYAPLDQIARTIRPHLERVGLSCTWDSETNEAHTIVHCTCIVRHVNGHRSEARCSMPIESSAGMSAQQKVAAAMTFAQRKSLCQALGLTTTEPDLDGQVASPESLRCIDREKADIVDDLIIDVGADKVRFLEWCSKHQGAECNGVYQITEGLFVAAVAALEAKRRKEDKGT